MMILAGWTSYIDEESNRAELDYNGYGELMAFRFYDGSKQKLLKEVVYKRDRFGRIITQKDRARQKWYTKRFIYDPLNLKTVKDDYGVLSQFSYNGFGDLVQQTNGVNEKFKFRYNTLGQLAQKSIQQKGVNLNEKYAYNALGQMIKVTNAKGQSFEQSFDSLGHKVSVKDLTGIKTEFTFNVWGQPLREKRLNRIREWRYNQQGQRISFKDGLEQKILFEYDSVGRLVAQKDSEGIQEKFAYNAVGEVVKHHRGDKLYTYKYNKLSRLIERVSEAGQKQSYSYNGLGQLIAAFDNNDPKVESDDVTLNLTYNSLGHLKSEDLSLNKTTYVTGVETDLRGGLKKIVYPSGEVLSFKNDVLGRLTRLRNSNKTLAQYEYAFSHQVSQETYGNGVVYTAHYDPFLRIQKSGYEKGDKVFTRVNYQYDAKGRLALKEEQEQRKWMAFQYNDYNQLKKIGEFGISEKSKRYRKRNVLSWDQVLKKAQKKSEYAYNLEGQFESRKIGGKNVSLVKGKGYQYAKVNKKDLKYDNQGNLTETYKHQYKYDDWNRLVAVVDSAGQEIARYTYDANNRRVTKQGAQDSKQTTFAYLGWNLLEEYSHNQLTKKYYSGRGLMDPIAFEDNNKTYYYHKDYKGSVVALSDKAGEIVQTYSYDEFGGMQQGLGSIENPLTYTGQYFDKETGLYYFKNRYYDSELGFFLTKDPMGYVDGPNTYAYVGNDPVNFVDFFGTEKTSNPWKERLKGFFWYGPKELVTGLYELTPIDNYIENFQRMKENPFYMRDLLKQPGGFKEYMKINIGMTVGGDAMLIASEVVSHPIQTIDGVVDYYAEAAQDPQGQGKIGFDLATFFVSYLKVSKVSQLTKVGKVDKFTKLTNLGKGKSVLGPFPQYINYANKIGAKHFEVPLKYWNKMTKAEKLLANQKFLDRAVLRGDKFIFPKPFKWSEAGPGWKMEVKYLMDHHGFSLSDDALRMVSPVK